MNETQEIYYFFSHLTTVSAGGIWQDIKCAGSPEVCREYYRKFQRPNPKARAFTEAQKKEISSIFHDGFSERSYEGMLRKKICYTAFPDDEYPERLRNIENPPLGIFHVGRLPSSLHSVGIVGSRKCTSYGREMAFYFGEELSKKGIDVISGMALGVDGYAGRGALSGKYHSYAVLGGGTDSCYPIENLDLFERLKEEGGILSERPMGYRAQAFDFPLRNRIISGLSDCLIVIEGAKKSGSRITADEALNQGKDVFALPGRITDPVSETCNELIRDGASILLSPNDIYLYFGIKDEKEKVMSHPVLSREEEAVFSVIREQRCGIEDLLNVTAFPLSELLPVLLRLEIAGAIVKDGDNYQARY